MTLTIPTTHAAVSDNPRLPVLAECPRERAYRIQVGGHWTVIHSHARYRSLRFLRLGRESDWHPDECNWCRQHRCDACKGKHRHCQRRWMATMRPQWRRESARIRASIRDGHTSHCAKRLVWGDGECECDNGRSRA